MTDDEKFDEWITDYIGKLANAPDGRTADSIVNDLPTVDDPRIAKVAAAAMRNCKITGPTWDAAVRRRQKAEQLLNRKAQARDKHLTMAQVFRLAPDEPPTARTVVAGYLAEFSMDYGMHFSNGIGKAVYPDVILRDVQLTAEEYGLTRKPYEIKDKSFERALLERMEMQRAERLDQVWAMIDGIQGGRDPATIETRFNRMCRSFATTDPALFGAVLKKVPWMVKRKMQGMYIREHHVPILHGDQDTGKSLFWQMFYAPLADLAKQVDVSELVSESQLDLYAYPLIDIDEMAKAERADISKFKSLVTKTKVSRRVFFTQLIRDVTMMAVIVGSSNTPVDQIIQDPTGMRRWLQLDVKPRCEVPRQVWEDDIAGFDFLGLWQSVDHTAEDPLEPFYDEIHEQQEQMRTKGRVETWVENFSYHSSHRIDKASSIPPKLYHYPANELYKLYQQWEQQYQPGSPMGLSSWGKQMKALIKSRRAKQWHHVIPAAANRTFYTFTPAAESIKLHDHTHQRDEV